MKEEAQKNFILNLVFVFRVFYLNCFLKNRHSAKILKIQSLTSMDASFAMD